LYANPKIIANPSRRQTKKHRFANGAYRNQIVLAFFKSDWETK
jgi:hypothetical protein